MVGVATDHVHRILPQSASLAGYKTGEGSTCRSKGSIRRTSEQGLLAAMGQSSFWPMVDQRRIRMAGNHSRPNWEYQRN